MVVTHSGMEHDMVMCLVCTSSGRQFFLGLFVFIFIFLRPYNFASEGLRKNACVIETNPQTGKEPVLNIVMCVVCIGIVYVCMGKGAIYNSSLQLAQEPYIINTSPSSCAPQEAVYAWNK